ncbi:hypothetical protein D3C81_1250720 [compost metagenome]
MNPKTARCADVSETTIRAAGKVQVMAQGVFQALQRHGGVVVWHFTEVEEQVVQRLQDVVAAHGPYQVDLLVGVVDALAGGQVNEGYAAALVVGEVHEAAAAAQALLPWQHPALAKHAVDSQVAGVEARPFNRHQAGQGEVDFVGQQFAACGQVDGVTSNTTNCTLHGWADDVSTGQIAAGNSCTDF